jgi:hypothetical protein
MLPGTKELLEYFMKAHLISCQFFCENVFQFNFGRPFNSQWRGSANNYSPQLNFLDLLSRQMHSHASGEQLLEFSNTDLDLAHDGFYSLFYEQRLVSIDLLRRALCQA